MNPSMNRTMKSKTDAIKNAELLLIGILLLSVGICMYFANIKFW